MLVDEDGSDGASRMHGLAEDPALNRVCWWRSLHKEKRGRGARVNEHRKATHVAVKLEGNRVEAAVQAYIGSHSCDRGRASAEDVVSSHDVDVAPCQPLAHLAHLV